MRGFYRQAFLLAIKISTVRAVERILSIRHSGHLVRLRLMHTSRERTKRCKESTSLKCEKKVSL